MLRFLGWLCLVAAAVIFWLLAFSVVTPGSIDWAAFALFATGFVLLEAPASVPAGGLP